MSAFSRSNFSPPPTARSSTRSRRASTTRGHWTIEGAVTSQFEQHIRAICGLPLGSTALVTASASMENLLGDDIARWPRLAAEPGAHVHLYGKGAAAARAARWATSRGLS